MFDQEEGATIDSHYSSKSHTLLYSVLAQLLTALAPGLTTVERIYMRRNFHIHILIYIYVYMKVAPSTVFMELELF